MSVDLINSTFVNFRKLAKIYIRMRNVKVLHVIFQHACKDIQDRVFKYFKEYNKCKFSEWCVYAQIVKDRDLENLKIENKKSWKK